MYIVKKTGYIISNYFNSHILRKAARVAYDHYLTFHEIGLEAIR